MSVKYFFFSLLLCCMAVHPAPKEKKTTLAAFSSQMMPSIILDPGHGGTDRGTKSKHPFCEEKRLCLQTSRLVKRYLDQLGYHVVMTRTSDAFISLPKRVEMAMQAAGSIFVSIHYNSAKNPAAEGIEIFCYDASDDKVKTSASKRLAESILPELLKRTDAKSRGVKKGNKYYVIRENSIPAIIIEGGFISNPEECALLKSYDYQDKIARAIAEGIDRYFKNGVLGGS